MLRLETSLCASASASVWKVGPHRLQYNFTAFVDVELGVAYAPIGKALFTREQKCKHTSTVT